MGWLQLYHLSSSSSALVWLATCLACARCAMSYRHFVSRYRTSCRTSLMEYLLCRTYPHLGSAKGRHASEWVRGLNGRLRVEIEIGFSPSRLHDSASGQAHRLMIFTGYSVCSAIGIKATTGPHLLRGCDIFFDARQRHLRVRKAPGPCIAPVVRGNGLTNEVSKTQIE